MLPLARAFHERGYPSLLFDFRNSGESDASVTSVGHFEKYDMLAAADFVCDRGFEEIALVGFSMGAAASLTAALEIPQVRAVVADSSFADLKPYLKKNLSLWTGLPNFPFTPLIMWEIPLLTGIRAEEVRPVEAVRRFQGRSLLLIHDEHDPGISSDDSRMLYQASQADKTDLWITPGDRHVGSFERDPELYLNKVVRFVEQSFSR